MGQTSLALPVSSTQALVGVFSGCTCTGPCDGEPAARDDKLTEGTFAAERESLFDLLEEELQIGDSFLQTMRLRTQLVANPCRHLAIPDCYEPSIQIGKGSFGTVYTAIAPGGRLDGRPQEVAVKVFSLTGKASEKVAYRRKLLENFVGERGTLAGLDHPFICKMFECFQSVTELGIVLEIAHGGELFACLDANRSGLPEARAQCFFMQMSLAVSYLHALHLIHRDIKPENFLLGTPRTLTEDVIKLCDFGTTKRLSAAMPRCLKRAGTLSYTAPEVYEHRGAAMPADIWSLGVVLYMMLTGAHPFRNPNSSDQQVVEKIRTADFEKGRPCWQRQPESVQDLICNVVAVDELRRLNSNQLLCHQWLADKPANYIFPEGSELEELASKAVLLMQHMGALEHPQKLSLAACALVATEADLSEPVAWRSLFLYLDTDCDGRLSKEELRNGLSKLIRRNWSLENVRKLDEAVDAADLKGTGTLDWGDWIAVGLLGTQRLSEEMGIVRIAHRLLTRATLDGDVRARFGDVLEMKEFACCLQLKALGKDNLSVEEMRTVLESCHH